MTEEQYDVVVIGSGPGGYVCAIRAAQLGLKTACVEYENTLGGTCLNVGCIPSKALLQSSERFSQVTHEASEHGIKIKDASIDVKQMMKRKDDVVKNLTSGIEYLFKKNKITWLKGRGSFADHQTLVVKGEKEEKKVSFKKAVIATGSKPIEIPPAKYDRKTIVSSTGALKFSKVPEHLIVVGGGVIGLEMGSVWLRLGAKVTVIEAMDRILAGMDDELAKTAKRIFEKQGMKFHCATKLTGTSVKAGKVTATCETKGETIEITGDKMLVAVGRYAYSEGLEPANAGVKLSERGKVEINAHFQTSNPNVYAIGDVVDGPMLAHKAEDEGIAVAEIIAGKPGHVNYNTIPGVVYTWPEIASVGKTEAECKEAGIEINSGKFPFSANGRAKSMGATDGFVKILADKRTDMVVGAHIIGPNASDLIAEIVIAMELGASSEDIARTCHAHPTLSEVTKEAAMGCESRIIHS